MWLFFTLFFSYSISYSWTNTYKKNITDLIGKKDTSYIWEQKDTKSFTQLIFSWNGIRPRSGYIKFEGQVRDAQTKKWHPWHEMIHWGCGIQKSFFSAHTDGSAYSHVRLETTAGKLADAFRIRITVHNKAKLHQLAYLVAATHNKELFKTEHPQDYYQDYASTVIRGVKGISQKKVDHEDALTICSPTSLCMLTSYIKQEELSPIDFANSVYDQTLKIYGNWLFNVAYAFEASDKKAFFYVTRLASFAKLYGLLKRNIPVVVSVRGAIKGAPQSYPGGHLLIVIGYNAKTKSVICHDPAVLEHYETLKEYQLVDFLPAWERSHRLAYRAEPYRSKEKLDEKN